MNLLPKIALLGLLGSKFALASSVPVIGLNADGRASVRMLPRHQFARVLGGSVSSVHETVLSELSCRKERGAWQLSSVVVGVGISGELGLGPIFSVRGTRSVRLVYSEIARPVIPHPVYAK